MPILEYWLSIMQILLNNWSFHPPMLWLATAMENVYWLKCLLYTQILICRYQSPFICLPVLLPHNNFHDSHGVLVEQ